MDRKTTTYERNALYAEVWSEPVTIVARRYAISDVGLCFICNTPSAYAVSSVLHPPVEFAGLSRHGEWRQVEVGAIWCLAVKR